MTDDLGSLRRLPTFIPGPALATGTDSNLLLRACFTVGFTAMMLIILHEYALRRDGSLLKNLGADGWAIAIEVVLAAGFFSALPMVFLAAPGSVSWTMALILGLIYGALGVGIFFLAWRTLEGNLPRSPAPAAQKG